MTVQEQHNVPPQPKVPDHYARKVHCPKCRARLMDVQAKDLGYSATLVRMGDKPTFDFSMKCPKCGSIVGISFARDSAIHYRTVPVPPSGLTCSHPAWYQMVFLAGSVKA